MAPDIIYPPDEKNQTIILMNVTDASITIDKNINGFYPLIKYNFIIDSIIAGNQTFSIKHDFVYLNHLSYDLIPGQQAVTVYYHDQSYGNEPHIGAGCKDLFYTTNILEYFRVMDNIIANPCQDDIRVLMKNSQELVCSDFDTRLKLIENGQAYYFYNTYYYSWVDLNSDYPKHQTQDNIEFLERAYQDNPFIESPKIYTWEDYFKNPNGKIQSKFIK